MPKPPENLEQFESLVQVVKDLRGPEGCPWDKEQTHQSLTRFAIEEAHELAEAIDQGDEKEMVEELGDLLLQVVLHAEIGRQEDRFNIHDVINAIGSKMVRRHPHVFDGLEVSGSDEVLDNWKKIKEVEKKDQPEKVKGFGIPEGLPSLIRSHKIGEKTRKMNFDWNRPEEVIEKVEEELAELKEAIQQGKKEEQLHEVGDLLFSVSQLARHLDIDGEQALRMTNSRFETRFKKMQEIALADGLEFSRLPNEKLEVLWVRAKKVVS